MELIHTWPVPSVAEVKVLNFVARNPSINNIWLGSDFSRVLLLFTRPANSSQTETPGG